MGVIFVPYLRAAAERATPSVAADKRPSKGRLAAGALVAGVVAWLAASRLRDTSQEAESPEPDQEASSAAPATRLRRVGKGWIRR